MPRYERFTFLVNRDERRVLEALAQRMQRSQSDAVRLLIREAARELVRDDGNVSIVQGQPVPQREGVQHATS